MPAPWRGSAKRRSSSKLAQVATHDSAAQSTWSRRSWIAQSSSMSLPSRGTSARSMGHASRPSRTAAAKGLWPTVVRRVVDLVRRRQLRAAKVAGAARRRPARPAARLVRLDVVVALRRPRRRRAVPREEGLHEQDPVDGQRELGDGVQILEGALAGAVDPVELAARPREAERLREVELEQPRGRCED